MPGPQPASRGDAKMKKECAMKLNSAQVQRTLEPIHEVVESDESVVILLSA